MRERARAAVTVLVLVGLGDARASAVAQEAVTSARRAELVQLLRHDCGACHGLWFKGGLGPPLLPETLAEKDPEALVLTVLEGRPGTPMPPWKAFLSEEEARFLVALLRAGRVP